jgi:hypothetical protein
LLQQLYIWQNSDAIEAEEVLRIIKKIAYGVYLLSKKTIPHLLPLILVKTNIIQCRSQLSGTTRLSQSLKKEVKQGL